MVSNSENMQQSNTKVTLNRFQGLFIARYSKGFNGLILCFNSLFLPFEILDFGSPASGEHYFTSLNAEAKQALQNIVLLIKKQTSFGNLSVFYYLFILLLMLLFYFLQVFVLFLQVCCLESLLLQLFSCLQLIFHLTKKQSELLQPER